MVSTGLLMITLARWTMGQRPPKIECPVRQKEPRTTQKSSKCYVPLCETLATRLSEARLDGFCRPDYPNWGGALGILDDFMEDKLQFFGSEQPEDLRALGFEWGKAKRDSAHHTSSRERPEQEPKYRDNERRLSQDFVAHLNKVAHPNTTQLTGLFAWIGQILAQDIIRVGEDNLFTCSGCTNPRCPTIDLLNSWDRESFDASCLTAEPTELCEDEEGQHVLNKVSAWVDASFLYGHSEAKLETLRASGTSRLVEPKDELGHLIAPFDPEASDCLNGPFCRCFQGGDPRTSANSGTQAVYLMFVRFHNFVAQLMDTGNPESRDLNFGLTREFVIHAWQKVVYEEWLPLLISPALWAKLHRVPMSFNGFHKDFGLAAFVLHQLVPDVVQYSEKHKHHHRPTSLALQDTFYSVVPLINVTSTTLLRGLYEHPLQKSSWVPRDLTESFGTTQVPRDEDQRATDVLASSIMRGRSAGLLPFSFYREYANYWLNSLGILPKAPLYQTRADKLKGFSFEANKNYDLNGLDPILGMMGEPPVTEDALVGGTSAVLIFNAFQTLQNRDPFFYTKAPWDHEAASRLRGVSLRTIVCIFMITTGKPEFVQANPLKFVDGQSGQTGTGPAGCCQLVRDFQFLWGVTSEPAGCADPVS